MGQILSNETKNSYGLIVKTDGIDLTRFKKNPVMLFNHWSYNIIGKWENIKVKGGELIAEPVFSETAKKEKKLYDEGVLKGASIGIGFKEKDLKGKTITKSVLYEASLVSVPANENCLKFYNTDTDTEYTQKELNLMINKKNFNMINFDYIKGKLGLSKEADEAEIVNATEGLKKEVAELKDTIHTKNKVNLALATENKALKAKIEGFEKTKKDDLINTALKGGLIDEALANEYAKLDFNLVKSTLERMKLKATDFIKTEADEKLDLMKMSDSATLKLKETNPNLYKKLLNK